MAKKKVLHPLWIILLIVAAVFLFKSDVFKTPTEVEATSIWCESVNRERCCELGCHWSTWNGGSCGHPYFCNIGEDEGSCERISGCTWVNDTCNADKLACNWSCNDSGGGSGDKPGQGAGGDAGGDAGGGLF
jgi:hypothetical protein